MSIRTRARAAVRPHRRVVTRMWVAVVLVGAMLAVATPASPTSSHALIQGSGSGWSANAVNQWVADVQASGLQVVYTASGSAQGRKDFGYRTNDFAVTEIGYQGTDPLTGESDTPQGRAFAYLPLVSGGTAFPYQIRVRGELVRDLRLSGETLAKIFTGVITDWSDPQITADNNGRALPSLAIIPVVHAEGAGSTAHFTDWLAKAQPAIWGAYAGRAVMTEYYPRKGNLVAQSGADGVMNFIASGSANGAIGYDEYSYALGKDYPVVKLENAAGYFTLPDQYNVAVSLTQAIINSDKNSPDYLLQNLDRVYTFNDPRVYPMSSYSYAVIPTGADDEKMTTAKRQTVVDFLNYSICDGQGAVGPIGYSPLPLNLVQGGFEQISKLKAADPAVDLTARDVGGCNNPTFVAGDPGRNYLAEVAPLPADCDRRGLGPCTDARSAPLGTVGAVGDVGPDGAGGAGAFGAVASVTAEAAGGIADQQQLAAVSGAAAGSPAAVGDVPVALAESAAKGVGRALVPIVILLLVAVIFAPAVSTRILGRRGAVDERE